jgi:hypothetical protein
VEESVAVPQLAVAVCERHGGWRASCCRPSFGIAAVCNLVGCL